MRVRAIRSHFVDGRIVPVGEVYEIRDATAHELIGAGRVVAEPEPVLPPVAEQAPASEPESEPPKPVAIKSRSKSKFKFSEADES